MRRVDTDRQSPASVTRRMPISKEVKISDKTRDSSGKWCTPKCI